MREANEQQVMRSHEVDIASRETALGRTVPGQTVPGQLVPRQPMIDVRKYQLPSENRALLYAWIGISFCFLTLFALFVTEPPMVFLFALIAGIAWFRGRMREAELLGNAVEVTPRNYPAIYHRVRQAQSMLGVEDIDIRTYIVGSGDDSLLAKRLGHKRILVLNGRAVEGVLSENKSAEIDYLIGCFIGTFKLRHLRFGPFMFLLGIAQLPLIGLTLKSWLRTTVYSGDRVGLVVAGDAKAAFSMMRKAGVGPGAREGYSIAGHAAQAESAQSAIFHTLYLWRSEFPSLGDRVLSLGRFARKNNAAAFFVQSDRQFFDDLASAPELVEE